jgi:UDPglucose--hexose-1-phosphate uridylyltransferase
MSEFRQEVTTGEYVIIASGRSKRPTDFKSTDSSTLPSFEKSCPFCPGQEHLTPPDVIRYQNNEGNGWSMRGFVNKFPILSPEAEFEPVIINDYFVKRGGAGVHEVLVETPRHNGFVPLRSVEEIVLMLKAYRERYLARREEWRGAVMMIFKNEGVSAGASIIHPHSQLLVTPLIPPIIEAKLRIAKQHFQETGRSIYREVEQWESEEAKSRLVLKTKWFTVFNPYASRTPFETRIIPRSDQASFTDMSHNEIEELATILLDIMGRFYRMFKTPDFNWIIYTAPYGEESRKDFIWHLQIQPRLTVLGGFEMGGGMLVNIVRPEDAASTLRGAEKTV